MMVSYNFRDRFAEQIRDGSKAQTIRAFRTRPARHARPGDELQLWINARTPRQELLLRAECTAVDGVFLHVAKSILLTGPLHQNRKTWSPLGRPHARDNFAIADGFTSWRDFTGFFAEVHGPGPFTGVLVRWRPLPEVRRVAPSKQQLAGLRLLATDPAGQIMPAYGKMHPAVGHSLFILKWAWSAHGSQSNEQLRKGTLPLMISDLGRQVLEAYDK